MPVVEWDVLWPAMPLVVVFRRIFLLALLAVPQWFWLGHAHRLGRRLGMRPLRFLANVCLGLVVLAIVLVLYDRIAVKFLPGGISAAIAPAVELWIFTSTFTFFLLQAMRALAWCLVQARGAIFRRVTPPQNPSRRSFFRYGYALVGATPFAAGAYGCLFERLHFEVARIDVPIAGLPHPLNGLRIVQLSDIHVGDALPISQVRRAVALANRLGAHLAVITGDFVTSAGDPLEECIAELSLLRAPLGVWGCNGNHEIYAGAEETAEALFQRNGMRLLRQSAAQLDWSGAAFNLMGVDYQRDIPIASSATPSLRRVEGLVRRDIPNILLSHNPNTFYRAAALGIELSLAGHTHGGQVNLEILHKSWSPARFMTRFVYGLYALPMPGDRLAHLYVTRGIGTLGIPARLGARPEIALLTLRSI